MVRSPSKTMDVRRQIHCPTCAIEFTLDVPRTWVRCPSCGHGFVVKRVSRELEVAAPKSERPASVKPPKKVGWLVTGPDGVAHRFDKVDDLRAAIVRGELEDPEPESVPMDVSMSEIEVAAPGVEAVGDVIADSIPPEQVLANEPSHHEIAPGVAVVPLDALDRLERRSDAPPSGERDRGGRSAPPPERPPSVAPRASIRSTLEDVTEFADNADIDDVDDVDDVDDDAAESEPAPIEETPLLLSVQTRTATLPPPSPVVVPKKERKKERKKELAERKTATSVARSVEPEKPSRSWTLPLLGVAAVGAIAWTFMKPGKVPESSVTAAPTAAVAPSTPEPSADSLDPPVVVHPEAEAAVIVIPATTATSSRPGSTTDTPPHASASASTSASVRAMTPGGDGGGADAVAQRAQASSAMRAGDYPKARLIFEQIVARNAQDVEAWSALGDVARAQRSMADAESAYRRALGINPRYLPSLIGLADIGWDNGDRAGAQKRYADLTDRFPLDMLPERVKTRAQ